MGNSEPHLEERRHYLFGPFTLDIERRVLHRRGEEVALRSKSFEVLAYLVDHPGELVTKVALMEAVWADTAVTDNSLAQCIVEIRRALDDDSQHLIRTIARRGYLFAAPVTLQLPELPRQQAVAPVEPRLEPVPPPRSRRLRRQHATLAGALVLAACAVGAGARINRRRSSASNS